MACDGRLPCIEGFESCFLEIDRRRTVLVEGVVGLEICLCSCVFRPRDEPNRSLSWYRYFADSCLSSRPGFQGDVKKSRDIRLADCRIPSDGCSL